MLGPGDTKVNEIPFPALVKLMFWRERKKEREHYEQLIRIQFEKGCQRGINKAPKIGNQ